MVSAFFFLRPKTKTAKRSIIYSTKAHPKDIVAAAAAGEIRPPTHPFSSASYSLSPRQFSVKKNLNKPPKTPFTCHEEKK